MQREGATSRATDPRPARTRAAIFAAVERLSAGAGAEFSMHAIARAAEVSRSALYAQFSDLDAIAVAMLREAMQRGSAESLSAEPDPDPDPDPVARAAGARDAVSRLVRHIAGRRAFYRASLDFRVTARVREDVERVYADRVRAAIESLGDEVPNDVVPADQALFIAGGVITVVVAWLREDEPSAGATGQAALVDRILAVQPGWLVGRTPIPR